MNRKAIILPVQEIMVDFARLTGLKPAADHPRRYLWTDAFAVCSYLELFGRTCDPNCRDLGLRLIDQVHHTLGRHRDDDPRRGWISGLAEGEGEIHPTAGGLRIGKELNERGPGEPSDERLEWDRDGQYYHYLTKWMHALNCAGKVTGDPTYTRWAIELAEAAHAGFVRRSPRGGRKMIRWKMSIDLRRPLVSSMGQHDPLDGLVTYCELSAAGAGNSGQSPPLDLRSEIAEMMEICRGIDLVTIDPLGIGGLLFDASRIGQLTVLGRLKDGGLLETVLEAALVGMEAFVKGDALDRPAEYRLAFRELGLSIGLSAAEELLRLVEEKPGSFSERALIQGIVEDLVAYSPLRGVIEQFWMDHENREARTWTDHREINMVMLATSLAPRRFLTI
ncbi:hypothetical protein [Methanocrinis sp.]|uniref:hypothetical protein n=1 Tax=Methanocrinis sp. TaxID=3101522 RepID=UPI003D0CD5F2